MVNVHISTSSPPRLPSPQSKNTSKLNGDHRVLLVDDDAGFRMLLRHALKTEAYTIYEAGDAQETLRLVAEVHPRIILLDICIPGVDGLSLLKQIREQWNDMAIFMTSSLSSQEWIEAALAAGATGYFTKPFSIEELRRRLRAV